MKDNTITYDAINNFHPTLILLLKKVCIIEQLSICELVTMIDQYRTESTSFYVFSSLFCAKYFAQSSTLQGHKAARHGTGKYITQIARDCNTVNDKRYDLSLIMPNDFILSEDRIKFEPSLF